MNLQEGAMEYITPILAVLASYHAHTYAQWLRKNGNKQGTIGIYVLILIALALPAYQLFLMP
jgi:hypothetical protein